MVAQVLWNYCKFQAAAGGTGSFTVSGAAAPDRAGAHDVPENCNVINGNSYKYYAQSPDGSETEGGIGVYSTATHTLSRVTIFGSSDNVTPHNFSVAPIVDVMPNPSKQVEGAIPSGTRMLFQQSSAPLGWTKDTTYNDYCPRIVTGGVSSGGVNGFSFTFSYRTDDAATLGIGQIPSHVHSDIDTNTANPFGTDAGSGTGVQRIGSNTGANGGSGSHQHTYDMRVLFVDFIIGVKS